MKKLIILILSLLSVMGVTARTDSLTVSLITCWPGAEVYELCGHEAIRIRGTINGQPIDSVWNYGTFDFNQPNFIYRFVKGETDYMLSSYPFAWFMPEYQESGRRVVEQDLNLTQPETRKILDMLRNEALPKNRVYRYNYVKDNCATRIIDDLDKSSESGVIYPDSIHYGTFRNEMRAYHKDYPWYQFGIDLALGSGIDYPIRGREEMFVPLEMMRKVANAHFSDGRPLVKETRVLNEGVADATLGPTHWSMTPAAFSIALLVIVIVLCFIQWRKNSLFRIVYCLWFGTLGIAGCLIAFLVFISKHEATSPNLLLLWLNPLQLLIAVGVWFRRRWRPVTLSMIYINIILLTILLIVWPLQSQSANPAFFMLMGATLAMAVTYAIIQTKVRYKNTIYNEEVSNIGAKSGNSRRNYGGTRAKRTGTTRSRTTKTRGRNRS